VTRAYHRQGKESIESRTAWAIRTALQYKAQYELDSFDASSVLAVVLDIHKQRALDLLMEEYKRQQEAKAQKA
jgi:hypothetical protein